jgi:hypothetical protein
VDGDTADVQRRMTTHTSGRWAARKREPRGKSDHGHDRDHEPAEHGLTIPRVDTTPLRNGDFHLPTLRIDVVITRSPQRRGRAVAREQGVGDECDIAVCGQIRRIVQTTGQPSGAHEHHQASSVVAIEREVV